MSGAPQIQHETDRQSEHRQIQRVALYGFVLNLLLTLLKVSLASFSGSLAVTASAVDSATDSFASLLLYAGLRLSVRKSASFPLGLYKIENVISVALGLSIFFAGYEIARNALRSSGAPPDVSVAILLWFTSGTIATLLFGGYVLRVGRKTESPTLMAEGKHRQVDVLSSVVVLLSIVIQFFEVDFRPFGVSIDQIAAGIVLIFIVHTGWELLSDGMRVLLDASIDFETLRRIRAIIEEEPLVAEVNSLTGRNAGRFRFLETSVLLRTDNLQKAHRISKKLEEEILRLVPHVEHVMIHYEPISRENIRLTIPLDLGGHNISSHFGKSPLFKIVDFRLADRTVRDEKVVENPYDQLESARGIRVAEWLTEQSVDEIIVTEDIGKKGPGYVLSDAGVKIHVVPTKDLEEALSFVLADHS